LRFDALDRNLMELPHRGYAFGCEAMYGHRAHWSQWGGVAFPSPDVHKEKEYLLASAYAVAAGGIPFVASERHRLISSLYGGIGKNLDRFSTFRLPGRPTGYEWRPCRFPSCRASRSTSSFQHAMVLRTSPIAMRRCSFYIRATYGIVERPRFGPDGAIRFQMDSLPALGGGVISGAPWRSQIEFGYSYNFGIFRDPGGHVSLGGHGFFALWSKEI